MKMLALLLAHSWLLPNAVETRARGAERIAFSSSRPAPAHPTPAVTVESTRVAAAPKEVTLIRQVQMTYRGAGDVSAKFAQTFYDKLRGKRPTETGLLWAKTDGRVRWSYREPVRKDFVYTGTQAYFYEPENAQVTVFEEFEDSPLANAIRFLWGQGSILDTFDVRACDQQCREAPSGTTSVLLSPKEPIPSVDVIQLSVDGTTFRVVRSVVFDPLGNRTEYEFSDIEFGAKVPDKKFNFRVPPGVNLIRATGEGLSPDR